MVLKSRLEAPDWTAGHNPDNEAKCRKIPLPTNNDPDEHNDPFFYDEEEARHVCNGTYDGKICPFRRRCAHMALVNNEQAGTFGGLTAEQRRWVRRQSRIPDSESTRIERDWWDEDYLWRSRVPSPEELAAREEDDGGEEDSEDQPA